MLEKLLTQVDATAAELFTGKFTLDELFKFIHALVKAAEVLVTEPHSGETKHALVKEAWEHYDHKYGLEDKLDDAIKFPWLLEKFDGPLIAEAVDLLISGFVSLLNIVGWK